jgi:putative redox protein
LLAAQHIESTEAVVTIGAPSEPKHVKENFNAQLDKIEETGTAEVTLAGRSFTIKKQFIDDLEATNMEKAIQSLKKPLLLFHSPQDNIVGIENAERIYKNAYHPKSFISLDGASHLLTKREDAQYVGHVIARWCERYVQLGPTTELATDQQVVTSIGREPYVTEVLAGDHHFLADEPTSVGGQDLGPTPYHLLNASLGTCTAITLRMYADRKEWPLEKVNVHLSHEKIHAKDCEDCETEEGKIDKITREIELVGDLDQQQRERLLQIANKCPVHRTLHGEIKVESRLKSDN